MTNADNNRYFKSEHLEHLESERIVLIPVSDQGMTDDGIDIWYAIVDKGRHTLIGMIGMVNRHPEWRNTELWIVIPDRGNRREGYGLEALELMEKYIFDILEYQRIAVRIADFNQTAISFFKRAGYKLEGVQELGCFYHDQYYDMILLRLLRKEYRSRQEIKIQ